MDIIINLPKPYDKQKEIILDKSRYKVVCAGRRVGKSVLCKIITIRNLIAKKRVAYITPEYSLGEKFYNEIVSSLPSEVISQQNKSRLNLKIVGGGELKFFSGEALHRSRGWEFDLLIVDEAAYVNDLKTEWDTSLRHLIGKTRGKAIFVSTPKGKNFFYSLFQKGINEDDGFKSWQFSTHYNPHYPKKELLHLIATIPEAAYRQEILAEPGENIYNPFGTDNINKNIREHLSTNPTVCYGIDFGRVNDWSVIVGQDANGNLTYFDRFKLPWEQTIDRVKRLREVDPYNMIVVDSTGVGSGLCERLQFIITNVTGFEFTSKSKPIIIHDLIKDVELGVVTYNEMIAQEMHTFEFKYTTMNNISYNAQSGFHDDCVAALAMCNHYRKKLRVVDDFFYVF